MTVFVSHHSSTAAIAGEVERALADRGVDCWMAPRDVEPGEPFDLAVRRAIERSRALLLLFSAEADRSRHVKRELILADDAGKPIIPLRLEHARPDQLAYHLADTQWIDWIERGEVAMDRVARKARSSERARSSEGERAAPEASRARGLAFSEFRMDLADERLHGPDGPIKLGNKAWRVLRLLIENEGRLLTKDALFESVWDGTIVSESSLTSVIKELRRALGDIRGEPRFIESVYGRGYRFIAPVSAATAEPIESRPPARPAEARG
ncbi:MAG: TIR domain-containing protein, partial [Sphingomonadaceae bacterium]|nr:TIR domain-containing protein [Sphingomonadaceae bacterium]